MDAEIHVGDIGTEFEVTIVDENDAVIDVSTAITKQIIFEKPDRSILTKSAQLSTDGSDGKIKCFSVAGDIDQYTTDRLWKIQGRAVFASEEWSSEIGEFPVGRKLQ